MPNRMGQGDLFGQPLLPGLTTSQEIVSEAEERELIARLGAAGLEPFEFQQWTGKRLTRSFGWTYDFKTGRFALSEPFPAWLQPIAARAAAFAGIAPDTIAQALLIEYGEGAGIGWHKDRPIFDHVIGISMGAEATMRFRRRTENGFARASLPLAPRGIYHLAGEARHEWEHSIAAMPASRWSMTFRSLHRDVAAPHP